MNNQITFKCLIVTLFILVIPISLVWSQTDFVFTYDDAGNLIHREIEAKKSSSHQLDTDTLSSVGKNIEEEMKLIDEDMLPERIMRIFPNPVTSLLNLEITGFDQEIEVHYQIFSVSGAKLKDAKGSLPLLEIDFSELPKGVYLLKASVLNENKQWVVIKK